jgi:hypothetical protein
MSQSNSFDPDQMLDRIVTALREEPIPDFHDPLATEPAGTPEPVVARHDRDRARLPARWRLGATCAVVLVLAVVAALVLRPQSSLAEVATAVLGRPWVHVRTVHPDQSVGEAWFSPSKDISAERQDGSARYEDYRLQVYYSYKAEEQVLYRVPVMGKSQEGQFESMAEGLKILLKENRPPEKPLAHLGFLGSERDKMKVLDQRVQKVTEQDHTWLDYRITVKYADVAEPVRMLFRVDASTKLPLLFRAEGHHDGKPVTRETQLDYPEKGPADIYDLGVPRTAKLVDRVPTGDLKRVIESIKAGRERMDDYRAVFVMQSGMNWWSAFPEVFYRKGNRFRRDSIAGIPRGEGAPKRPAEEVDRRQWWFDRAKVFRFYPVYVQLGPTSYTCDPKNVVDPDGSEHLEIAAVQKFLFNPLPGAAWPVDYAMRPEFACRTLIGPGDESQEPVLDLHPAEGPAGCILLTMRRTTKEGQVNEKGVGIPDGNRFWLDPQRDYIVMRWDMVMRDGTGKETISHSQIVEETARSPQGVWYATKIRLKDAVRDKDGNQSDQFYHIYVDFDAELPDSLFEPPTPRRIE